jgi:hypothetical protein
LRYDFHLRAFPWGLRFYCGVGLRAGTSRSEWLDYLNTANKQSHITHFSLDEDGSGGFGVRMYALASGTYSRKVFALVMDMWHYDLDRIRRKPDFLPAKATTDGEETPAVTVH